MEDINKEGKRHFFLYELNISLIVSIICLGIAFGYALGRVGFVMPYHDILNVSGVGLFIICLPLMIHTFESVFLKSNTCRFIGSTGILTLLTVIFLILCSYGVPFIGYWFVSLLAILGYSFFIVTIYLFLKSQSIFICCSITLIAALMALWLIGRIYSSYHNPLAFENLALGKANRDILYHTSIMQMIKTYGIPSTGLHGTPYLPYHWGSHWTMARFSVLLNISALTTYNLVYPVIFISLFLKAFLTFTFDLFSQFSKTIQFPTNGGLKFWGLFLVFFVTFLPSSFLANWAIWEAWIESESYTLALAYFFLFASLCLFLYNTSLRSDSVKSKLSFILIPVLLPLAGLLKISILVISLAIIIYLFARLRLYKNWVNTIAILATVALSYYVLSITASTYTTNEENNNFYLFHFVKSFSLGNWKGVFYYLHYFYTIFYIYLRYRDCETEGITLKKCIGDNKLLDVEILIVVSLVGLLPVTLFGIAGGSGYYFTDFQTRLSGAFIFCYILLESYSATVNLSIAKKSFTNFLNRFALLIPLILIMAVSNIFAQLESAINENMSSRIGFAKTYTGPRKYLLRDSPPNILGYTSGRIKEVIPKLKELTSIPPLGLDIYDRYYLFLKLSELDKLSVSEKRKLLVFIPRSNQLYWESLPGLLSANLAPVLTGIASVGGLPATIDLELSYLNYGYHTYKEHITNGNYQIPAEDSLCVYAKKWNKVKILKINSGVRNESLNRRFFDFEQIKCP